MSRWRIIRLIQISRLGIHSGGTSGFSGAIFAPLIETEYVQTLESGEGL